MQEGLDRVKNLKTSKLETAPISNHGPLFAKFWKELLTGNGTEITKADIEELVNLYTDVEPLTSVTIEELTKIKEYLRRYFILKVKDYNYEYKTLINDEIVLINQQKSDFRLIRNDNFSIKYNPYLLLNLSQLSKQERYTEVIKYLNVNKVKPLTVDQKMKLFNDPEFFKTYEYYCWNPLFEEMRLTGLGMGSRRLTDREGGGYYSSDDEFLHELNSVRERTGKLNLKILDIGSNLGFALKDMKDLDKNIETFNMTISEHPAVFGDHIVSHPAEMMPKKFEEDIDLIESSIAFRYFLYTDIALKNTIMALSLGGEARIAFETHAIINYSEKGEFLSPEENTEKTLVHLLEMKSRQEALWNCLKTLIDQGYIDISGSDSRIQKAIVNPFEHLTSGFIKIVKKKSTKNLQF